MWDTTALFVEESASIFVVSIVCWIFHLKEVAHPFINWKNIRESERAKVE